MINNFNALRCPTGPATAPSPLPDTRELRRFNISRAMRIDRNDIIITDDDGSDGFCFIFCFNLTSSTQISIACDCNYDINDPAEAEDACWVCRVDGDLPAGYGEAEVAAYAEEKLIPLVRNIVNGEIYTRL